MESKYIRADLLMNKIAGSAFFSAAEKGKIRAVIEKEPGEDVKPVVHAHWIQAEDACGSGYNFYECSACKEIQFLNFGTPQWNEWNYCPNCGAKMIEPQESEKTE